MRPPSLEACMDRAKPRARRRARHGPPGHGRGTSDGWTGGGGPVAGGRRTRHVLGVGGSSAAASAAYADSAASVPGFIASDPSPLDERAVEVLSHELRSPITTIHLGAKMLRSSDVDEPVREAVIEAVDVEAFRLLRVVEDLLVVVRHDAGASTLRVEPILVQRRLADLVWSDEVGVPNVPIRYAVPAGVPAVMADEEALGHALRNLLTNAATHGAGPAPTEVVVDMAGPWVEIAVLDRGPGLDPAETERLFRPSTGRCVRAA